MIEALTLALAIILLLFLSVRLSFLLARRAVCQVISTFRRHRAVEPREARTLQDLGLVRSWFSMGLRDYKPWALQTLLQAGVIKVVMDDMFYLSEEKLDSATQLNAVCGTGPVPKS
ncbi:MAG: hypothetical protein HYX96_00645 [Chloroflexi bacterium]|nr:hypothetical protein [Chloroflexota bacterium]